MTTSSAPPLFTTTGSPLNTPLDRSYQTSKITPSPSTPKDEQPDYLIVDSDQLYYVLTPSTPPPRAQVLLVGPFASERSHAYRLWARWARYLAAQGFDVLRFDFRGVGESTGAFENHSFTSWEADIHECVSFLRARSTLPLFLHGVGMGALLSSRLFNQGLGEALLLWSPPVSARAMLYDTLRMRMATDFALHRNAPRRTREDYIAELESGQLVEVEGFLWSERLWRESENYPLTLPPAVGDTSSSERPWSVIELDRRASDLMPVSAKMAGVPTKKTRPGTAPPSLNSSLGAFFEPSCAWLHETATKRVAVRP